MSPVSIRGRIGYDGPASGGALSLLFLSLLSACDGEKPAPPERCDPVTRYQDRDRDGYGDPETAWETCKTDVGVADGTDCDDADATVHPDAADDCAIEKDFNCDGSIGYADADADGSPACLDCDDTDRTRSPGAFEVCDDVDQDCDGVVDDDPVDGRYYYADADEDGFGDADSALRTCALPEGYTTDLTDCDDTNAVVNPDGVEVCDTFDNDCDGAVDDASALDATTWYRDADSDGWGTDAETQEACEQPRRFAADPDDCDDTDAAVNPGAVEVCNGLDDDCDGGTDDSESSDATTFYTDADTDGHGDADAPALACSLVDGLSDLADDCDDADATAYPDAPETCDDVDDDCDGAVDEDPTDPTSWYSDADGDGYGDPATSTAACDAPAGTVADATDCDDADATVNPGATEVCDGVDQDCDGTADDNASDAPTWYADADHDGYGGATARAACTRPSGYLASSTDCDDADAAISPAATETCDGEDDDCDGTVDEADASDAGSWYADADGDGQGDPAVATVACTAPVGNVANATDCDDGDAAIHVGATEADCLDPVDYNCDGSVGTADTDADGFAACEECDDGRPTVNPDATEACDGLDDDCDGAIDESGATGSTVWYADLDGDGFGDPARTTEACEPPAGYLADATDCDDADAAVNPDGTETCTTTADDDCDGDTNPRNADGCTRFYFDWDGDGYGSTSNACLCEAEGYLSSDNAEDCDDGDAGVSPAAAEIWGNDLDENCDDDIDVVATSEADAIVLGDNNADGAGTSVAGVGDVNADGWDDVLVGATGADGGGNASGGAYLFLGPLSGTEALADADARLIGESPADAAGIVGPAGDVDGDGEADLLVGATGYLTGGGVYLVLGPVTGTLDLSLADARWDNSTGSAALGTALFGAGDLDGDGIGDFTATAPGANEGGGSASGAVYVLDGSASGGSVRSDASATLYGEARNDRVGDSVTVADLDGDGVLDVAAGAIGDDDAGADAGAVYVVLGPFSGSVSLATADAKLLGADPGGALGGAIAADDLDGDGAMDLVLGAEDADGDGAVYVVDTPTTSGSVITAAATLTAVGAGSSTGISVATIGDLDGDGLPELLVGAPADDTADTDAGAAAFLYGPFAGTRDVGAADGLFVGVAGDETGTSVANAGDTDGDGLDDLLLGAIAQDDGGTNAGAAFLFLGR